MSPSRSVRAAAICLAFSATACAAASPTPRTFVDQPTHTDSPAASAPLAVAPESVEIEDVEPTPVPIEGSDLVEARASVLVRAPVERARAAILEFEDYPEFMPEYSGAKRLGKLPNGNEKVYMEITTLGGAAKMYANVEVMPVDRQGTTEVHQARFLDGNVKQFKAVWRLTPARDGATEMSLQVFLHPSIPLPDFLVNMANLDGAKKGVLAMKRRIEASRQ